MYDRTYLFARYCVPIANRSASEREEGRPALSLRNGGAGTGGPERGRCPVSCHDARVSPRVSTRGSGDASPARVGQLRCCKKTAAAWGGGGQAAALRPNSHTPSAWLRLCEWRPLHG